MILNGRCEGWDNHTLYDHEGFLPGGIQLSAMETESWLHQYCFYDEYLCIGYGRTAKGAHMDFTKAWNAGF